MRLGIIALTTVLLSAACSAIDASDYFAIEVVDDQTGRGVPMVELETVNNIKLCTDSAGVAAFFEPGLMNQTVYFGVKSHGYEFQKDGFGFAGKQLEVKPGGKAQLKIKRVNVAERLYRVTGAGIYADTIRLGHTPPIKAPVLNGGVLGLDSVQPVVYRDRIWWFWGDTNRAAYPLGNFHTTGATSDLPGKGGLDPSVGVDLTYLTNEQGFVRKMVPMPEGVPGPVWTDAVFTVNENGAERLVGHFSRVKDITTVLERGIILFSDEKGVFEKQVDIPLDYPLGPRGQAVDRKVTVDGTEYQLFCHWGPPNIRVPAQLAKVMDVTQYEAYTPLAPGARFDGKNTKLHRQDGKLIWGWKRDTATLSNREQNELIAAGLMRADESPQVPVDVDTGKPVQLHSASVQYNEFRKCWVMIALEFGGTSILGEVWYSEAPAPEGPWKLAKKVVTHNQYSFYNPRQHAFFAQEDGRYVFFEGTYSNSIAANAATTPRYEYNQLMYRLDLTDPRLSPLRVP